MATLSTDQKPSPWHQGERAIQATVGVVARMEAMGRRVIRDYLVDQHRQFYPQLPFIVAGTVDPAGDAWATLIAGRPGFLQSPDPATLTIDAPREPSDPADPGLDDGMSIGLLGIELQTRRRNRMNGMISRRSPHSFSVGVDQSYGNCPQYIQMREFEFAREPAQPYQGESQEFGALDDAARAMIVGADSFYVATYDDTAGRRQVDVSHRGGKAGFVRVGEEGLLTIPDFAGNLFFNTLGNIHQNGRAGLVFVDFDTGGLLQMTGEAAVVLESPEIAAFQGAERFWTFRPRRIVYRAGALPLRWSFAEDGWSPNSLMTGSWEAAAQRLRAAPLAARWRPFRVSSVVEESSVIRSLYLEPTDGAGLIPHAAGQFLPIRVVLSGDQKPTERTYTLSAAPSDEIYRISVKKEGNVSTFLHRLQVGDIIEARAPDGGFTIDAHAKRPAVLLAAGIGITPMIAMLRHIVYEGIRTRSIRPTWLVQSARNRSERAFAKEAEALARAAGGNVRLLRVLGDTADAAVGTEYDEAGRIDLELLRRTLPFDDYDFYLCGPTAFMQSLYDGLRSLNVADDRIHAEAFGPASMKRDVPVPVSAIVSPASKPTPVVFTESAKEARWEPAAGSLLELAEARGLVPAFSCRSGSCGSCRVKLLKGQVAYPTTPTAPVADGEVLLCSAVPAEGSGRLEIAA